MTRPSAASAEIGDHAIVGDGRSAALVSGAGSVDWLCWPEFGSSSLFGSLLDPRRGGEWTIGSDGAGERRRTYLGETNVLRTVYRTATGVFQVTDWMPVAGEARKGMSLRPEHELLRVVECTAGEVGVDVRFAPRPAYGRASGTASDRGALGIRVETAGSVATLHPPTAMQRDDTGAFAVNLHLRSGETAPFSLTFSREAPAVLPGSGEWRGKLADTIDWWRRWAGGCDYEGDHRDVVLRSALALKLLMFAPSGAIVAAPTTSLPERPGGELNWDYRFCWLRDAAFTARALLGLGYREEARAFAGWLLHSTRLTQPRLLVLYDVWGRRPGGERILSHLAGYGGARPVRIGNAAAIQTQLDVYGEVVDAMAQLVRHGEPLDRETRRLLARIGEYVCGHWCEPDAGIWEDRDAPRHHVHSKAMCWVALDRLLDLADRGLLEGLDVAACEDHRSRLRRSIEADGWSSALRSYTSTFDGDEVDASLLGLGLHGFTDPASPRMRATAARIEERLVRNGLLDRNERSREAGEGAFAACSFWYAELLARAGEIDRAERLFELVLDGANDLGLFAELIEPASGAALGNFPQAFTHVALINAARELAAAKVKDGMDRHASGSEDVARAWA